MRQHKEDTKVTKNLSFVSNQNQLLPKVRVAVSSDEKELIYRLRYKVYVEGLNEPLLTVDHKNKKVKDELDDTAVHVSAVVGNDVICAGRLNFIDDKNQKAFPYLQVDKIDDPSKMSMVVGSNIVIDYEYRDLGMLYTVLQSMYRLSLTFGAKIAIGSIPNYLVSTFSKMGFISYKGQVHHPEMGLVTPMYLDLLNEGFMIDIDSPFLETYRLFQKSSEVSSLN